MIDVPDLDSTMKSMSLKVDAHQLEDLSEGKGAIIDFSDDDDNENSDYESGEDSDDELGYLNTIRPGNRKRFQALDAESKQSLIKSEVMSLTQDFKAANIELIGKDYANCSDLEVSPNLFASNVDDEYKTIHMKYSRLGNYNELAQSGDFISVVDNMVYKNTIRPGTGSTIDDKSTVIFHYACWTEFSAEPYDSTWLRKRSFVAELSHDNLIPGIRLILKTMKSGERAEGIINPLYAYKELGVPPRIPQNATVFCLIQVLRAYNDSSLARLLINPSKAQESGITFETFMSVCNNARTLGNYYLKNNEPWQALDRYKSARIILNALTFKDEVEEKAAYSLLIKLYNNSSNALLQLNKPRTSLTFCKLALELDPADVKAHWFYVRSWETLRHYERALKWAKRGLNIAGPFKTSFLMRIDKLNLDLKRDKRFRNDLMRKMGSCFE